MEARRRNSSNLPGRRPSRLPPREPPGPPPEPNPIVAWFMGVNMIARVGMVILFLGLAFLLKFAPTTTCSRPSCVWRRWASPASRSS
jgi:uncharacterized membrane protein